MIDYRCELMIQELL